MNSVKNLIPKCFKMLHGADYNPEQWLDRPDILEKDIKLMKAANINCVSLGIFAWSNLEPEEGVYTFDWMAKIIDDLYSNGIYTILATPSGAKPVWMSEKYIEIRRVNKELVRELTGSRHNHCYTSPTYRDKVRQMDAVLAQQFSHHPGVIMWHISNEFGGECYCPLCQEAFRTWLKEKYGTLDAVNDAWWTNFWSHKYTDWSQIVSPLPIGETNVHGLNLDWKRFVTYQTIDFLKWEKDIVKSVNPDIPVTTNLMEFYDGLNYFKFKDILDVVSWDEYPAWHECEDDVQTAARFACMHDLMRSIKQQPFLLMESTPSVTNWQGVSKLKRPQMHMLASMQAVAHGSNSVQYFQWRKSRGSCEKLHGAVVDHYGESDTRVFREVTEVGVRLNGLDEILKTNVDAQVAIVYDWENKWAIDDAKGPRNCGKHYLETVLEHHQAFWEMGVSTDIIDMECDFSKYKIVVAPMLYLYRAGIEKKMRNFVQNGGVLVGGYWSGIVNETDLCFLGGAPANMMDVFGVRSEEIDALYDNQYNMLVFNDQIDLPLKAEYTVSELCDIIHCSTAKTLAVYGEDFYKDTPALTVNQFGKGKAYYLAAKAENQFYRDFYNRLVQECDVQKGIDAVLPYGVTVSKRTGEVDLVFLQNFNNQEISIEILTPMADFETGKLFSGKQILLAYEVRILRSVDK